MAVKEDNHLEQKIQLEEIIAEETGEFRILKGLERYFIPVIAFARFHYHPSYPSGVCDADYLPQRAGI